jgi:D-alanine transaminase
VLFSTFPQTKIKKGLFGMSNILLYDDRLIQRKEAWIDVEDRAFQFGDGVYEVIRVYNGKAFYLQEHMMRFKRSANEVQIAPPYPIEKLTQLLLELVEQSGLKQGNIYLQVSRGTAPRSHAFPQQVRPLIIAYPQPSLRPDKELSQGVAAITTEDIRWLRCDIKSLNLLGAVLAKQKAVDQHAHEAILIRDGVVTEGSSTNIFIVKDDILWTHPANHLILHGITRKITLQLADELGIPISFEPFSKETLLSANECMMTSTTMEICPIVSIDGQTIGSGTPGPVTRQLQKAFNELISL